MLFYYKKKDIFTAIKNIFLTILGTTISAFGTAVFIIPFNLVVGGASSIAIILNQLISAEFVTVDLLVVLVTWILFFIGWIFLGKNFALKTLISAIVFPIGVYVFSKLIEPDICHGLFCLQETEYIQTSILLAAFFGGVCTGAGRAIAFLGGGSTGGVDILALLLCKYIKKLRSSVAVFMINGLLVVWGLFVIKDLVVSLLGILSVFVSAIVEDKIFIGESQAFIAQIISEKYEEINHAIIERMARTTTFLDITGGYTKNKKKMLMVSFTASQYAELIHVINKMDPCAFITIHRAYEIEGEGWTRQRKQQVNNEISYSVRSV